MKKTKSAGWEEACEASKDDTIGFTDWAHLLQHVDSKDDMEAGGEAFLTLLKACPYCYDNWKKFSDYKR